MTKIQEALDALDEVRQAINAAYASGYSAGSKTRQWVGLTAEDLAQIESDEFWSTGNHMAIALAVEDALKEKNT